MALYYLYLLLVPLLQAFWLVPAHSYVLDTPQSLLTAAPILNQFDKRQDLDQVTCSQWSILGGGVPVCSAGRTCIFNYDIPYWGCYPAAQTGDVFVTECNDWPTTNSVAGDETLYCPQSAPSCGAFVLENTVGGTFTNLGCSALPYDLVATQVLAFTSAINAGPTTITVAASAASPVTVTVSATGAAPTNAAPVVSSPATTNPLPTTSPTSSSPTSSTSSMSSGGGGSSGSTSSNAATIGGAVGGAVGGLALIAAAIFIWLFLRKQRRKAQMEQSSKEPGIQSPGPSPYSATSAPYSPKGQLANC